MSIEPLQELLDHGRLARTRLDRVSLIFQQDELDLDSGLAQPLLEEHRLEAGNCPVALAMDEEGGRIVGGDVGHRRGCQGDRANRSVANARCRLGLVSEVGSDEVLSQPGEIGRRRQADDTLDLGALSIDRIVSIGRTSGAPFTATTRSSTAPTSSTAGVSRRSEEPRTANARTASAAPSTTPT